MSAPAPRQHAPGTWYLAPADDPGDEYAAGYDGNVFASEAEATAAIPELVRCMRRWEAPDDATDDTEWVAQRRCGSRFFEDGYRMVADVWRIDPAAEDEWEEACRDYHAGCMAGVLAQSDRTGLPPRDRQEPEPMKATTKYTGTAGVPYGHVPGHTYHDVDCELTRRGSGWVCVLTETWGSAQGYDEEHGRNIYRATGPTADAACREARGDMPQDAEHARRYASTACAKALAEVDAAGGES